MSKKIDSFRRAGSREAISPIIERLDATPHNNNNNDVTNNNKNNESCEKKSVFGSVHRSPSPFKSFFIRMGSTGMLNSTKGSRRSQVIDDRHKTTEKENLFRSCSTSQLNTSPTYVKGDDPSEGIDLQLSGRKDKTVSCDNLNDAHSDIFDDPIPDLSNTCSSMNGGVFSPCDFGESRSHEVLRKSSSCDFKEVKKTNFPYAFLRSKLSVLPEERHGSGKDERLFKTASEEHFPTLIVEDSFEGTTTLGRRRPKNVSCGLGPVRDLSARGQDFGQRYARNSYAESSSDRLRCDKDRYSLNATHLERIEDGPHLEDPCYGNYRRSPMSLPLHSAPPLPCREPTPDFQHNIPESRYPDSVSLIIDPDGGAALRSYRRNSAPSEQRLSSHYVSSNESGYDSDGPRGSESTAASENEALSLKCADSSDTSSVLDSEIEKPLRSSTPQENTEDDADSVRTTRGTTEGDRLAPGDTLDGLRWHQSSSGRMLPSIHQGSLGVAAELGRASSPGGAALSARAKMQLEKSRFLNDIIQPPKKVKRCRVIQLTKKDPKEHLGIRLAQQRVDELRYVIVQLESDGIAHRDGRLRLGDEIIEVESRDLRTMESLEQVQHFLKSFTGNKVRLKTMYEETVPQVYASPSVFPGESEYLENAKNLSKMSALLDSAKSADATQPPKRPDYLPIAAKHPESGPEVAPEAGQYFTKHVARFEKGLGKPSLGFSVVGGRDSPRGDMGIFVRRVFPGGQADVSKMLFQGDEIISLNGKVLRGCTHQEVIELFKAVREGTVELEVARRHRYQKNGLKSAPC